MRYYEKLEEEVSDTSLPVLKNDDIISEGSLLLVDFGKSQPDDLSAATKITNIAYVESMALTGEEIEDNISPYIAKGSAADGIVFAEMTGKNGLHTAISQTNHTDKSTQYFGVYLPVALINYLWDNRANNFFVSVWRRNTRANVSGAEFAKLAMLFNNTANYLSIESSRTWATGSALSPTDEYYYNGDIDDDDILGIYRRNVGFNGITGTANESYMKVEESNFVIAQGGHMSAFTDSTILNKLGSYITYRVYIEDLTVSGRDYATVDAIDKALYDEAFAEGGRFYEDTYTDPATLD